MNNYKKGLVSFVILNWNGIEDTLVCLDSIREQNYENYEIIVLDNGSEQYQKDKLRNIKDIIFIDLPSNTGFTGGQIRSLDDATGEYIALINNDSVVKKNWTVEAIKLLNSDKNVGAVGGRAYSWNDELNLKAYDETNPFYSFQVVNPKTGHTTTLQTGNRVVSVNSISGSAVLIDREVLDVVGYFDNQFFAYYEETDLFARMKRAGYKILYGPSMQTWHKIAQSTKSMPGFYLYHMHRNRFLFATKNLDSSDLRSFWFFYFKECFHAFTHVLRRGHNADIGQKKQLKAGLWNLFHLPTTLSKRVGVKQLGSSYSKTLLNDAYEDVTIVIPCYNYAQYVEEAIVSATNQSYKPNEILIIDDGSKDDSVKVIRKVVKELSEKHPEIVFTVLTQQNKGTVPTKNRAIEEVKTKWLIFLDADDVLHTEYVKKCIDEQRAKNADVVYTDMLMFGAVEQIQKVLPYNKYRLRTVNFIHNSALFRVDLLRKINGYGEDFKIGFEDWELNLKLSKVTSRFNYIPEPLLKYRRHEGASRDSNAQQKLTQVVKLLEKTHPELYNLRFYIWLESDRAKSYIRGLIFYPYLVIKHSYYHSIMLLDRKAHTNKSINYMMKKMRKLKKSSDK